MWLALLACRHPQEAPNPGITDGSVPYVPDTALVFDGAIPRNLVVISLDTTRRDRLGHFSGLPTTPFLDARLSEGVVLEDHRTCSNWTAPSMLCATTGYAPHELGFWPGSGDRYVEGVPQRGLPTVARALSQAGFATSLVTGNAVFSNEWDTTQGFDTVILRNFEDATEIRTRGTAQLDKLLEGGQPFYLHLHFMDPHREYCPPESYRAGLQGLPEVGFDLCTQMQEALEEMDEHDEAFQQALLDRARVLYDGELRYFDDQLALLWAEMEERGALDDALVVFWTDHGEQQLERGKIDHGFELFAEENRAAAAFWAKNLEPMAYTAPTLHQDLAATILELHGSPLPETASGKVLGHAPADRVRRLFAYSSADHGPPQLGIVQGDRVLHYDWAGTRSLHHTDTDPAELVDVYSPGDPEVIALWGEMSAYLDEIRAVWPHLPDPTAPGP